MTSVAVAEPKVSKLQKRIVEESGNPLLGMLGQLATSPNFNAEAFKMVVDLVREEKAATAKAEFRADFAAFQSEMPPIPKGGKGHNGKPHERLEDIFETTKPLRAKYGFSLNHEIKQGPSTITIVAILGHRGGHEAVAEMALPLDASGSKNAVQAHGSTTTYGKRYTAMAVLGLAASDEADDDGKAAGNKKPDASPLIAEDECKALKALLAKANLDEQIIFESFNVNALSELTKAQHDEITVKVSKKLKKS